MRRRERASPHEFRSTGQPTRGSSTSTSRRRSTAAHLSGDGDFTRRCQDLLSELLGGATILLTTSGTHALELMALLLDIGPGDEVIVPSFTFSSTVNAFVLRGATPVFIDIRRDTLNLDESKLEALDHPATRARSCRCTTPASAARWM